MGQEGGKRKVDSRGGGGEHRAKAARVTTPRGHGEDREGPARSSSGGDDESSKRDKVHKIIADAIMGSGAGTSRSLARSLAEEIEESLYSLYSGTGPEYASKAKSIKFNLMRNQELRDQVLSRHLPAVELAAMDSSAMASSDLQKRRVALAEESLKDTINTSEVQALRDAAEGLSMRKTDQGLMVEMVEEKKETAADDHERTSGSEEDQYDAKEAAHKADVVQIPIDRSDQTYMKHTFEWKPTGDEGEEDNRGLNDSDDHNVISSPTLDDEPDGEVSPAHKDDDFDEEDELLRPTGTTQGEGRLVWSGTMMWSKEEQPFDVDASLVDGKPQPELMTHDLVLKGKVDMRTVKEYIKRKAADERKLRSVFTFVPAENAGQDAYDQMSNNLAGMKQVGVLQDNKYGALYLIPPGDLSRLMAPDAQQHMIGVSITTKQSTSAKSVEEIVADVSSDLSAPSGETEKMVKLVGTTLGKAKIETCRLRASLLSGKNNLEQVPKDFYVLARTHLGDVIDYLAQLPEKTVMDLEPDGEEDTPAYLDVCKVLEERGRALIVLDTPVALMYIIPPVAAAGRLLTPQEDSPSNLLGVLVLNKESEEQGATSTAKSAEIAATGAAPSTANTSSQQIAKQPAVAKPADPRADPRTSGATPQQHLPSAGPAAAQASWGSDKLTSERPPALVIGQGPGPHMGRGGGVGKTQPADGVQRTPSWGQNDPSPRPHYTPAGRSPMGVSPTGRGGRGGGMQSPRGGRGGYHGSRGWDGEGAAWRTSPRGGPGGGASPMPGRPHPYEMGAPYGGAPYGGPQQPPFPNPYLDGGGRGGYGAGPPFPGQGYGGPPPQQYGGSWGGGAPGGGPPGGYGRQGEGRGYRGPPHY